MVYLPMKRSREAEIDSLKNMANCLMMLSQAETTPFTSLNPNRVFECKTCNRQFQSFQALGGHRASHKRPRLADGNNGPSENSPLVKTKSHECSICGVVFSIGQALGGHMRRHRAGWNENNQSTKLSELPGQGPVVKKSNSRRVFCLDLNLTPYENDLEFGLGKVAPMVECFL